jgi:hypothetical protein
LKISDKAFMISGSECFSALRDFITTLTETLKLVEDNRERRWLLGTGSGS